MALPVPYDKQILINSIDVSTYILSYEIEIHSYGVTTSNVLISKEAESLLEITNGSIIEIYEGEFGTTLTRSFYGIIVEKEYDISGYNLVCNDEYWKASGQTITKLYDTEDPSDTFEGDFADIMIDLITRAGLTTDSSCIDSTAVIIPQVLCDSVKADQKILELAQILYWDVYQNPIDRKIYVRNPETYTTYTTTLTVGENVVDSPTYTENIYQTINEVEIQGIRTYPLTKETFTFDGGTTYTVAKYPIQTYIKITNSTTETVLSGAVEGTSGTFDYYVNLNLGKITFTTAPTANMDIEYTATELISILVDDSDSKEMTKGTRKIVLSITDSSGVDDVTQRANAILDECKDYFSNFTIKAYNVKDLTPRYKVNFVDPIKNKTLNDLTIIKIKNSWPEFTTEITLGKYEGKIQNLLVSVEERVKKLERIRREGIILRVNKLFNNDLYITLDDLEITRQEATGDQFILGDATYGVLGENHLGIASLGTAETIVKRKNEWKTTTELAEGTAVDVITTSNQITMEDV